MFDSEFYPTPVNIVQKMLNKITKSAKYFLEPSAGKGNIAEVIKNSRDFDYGRKEIDCIEPNPELIPILEDKGFPVVGFDFLSYDGICYYDAIIMNPPFSNGDEHLLKAWNFLFCGEIVCLLNAETIKNPYTKSRQLLAEIIKNHGSVEFLGDCFSTSERKTGVNVAMVYLKKQGEDDSADLWSVKNQEKQHVVELENGADLALIDNLGNMQHFYDKANEHMFKAIEHIRKAGVFMHANDLRSYDFKDVLSMAFENSIHARASFAKAHRKKAWENAINKTEFTKWLDSKQRDEMSSDIARGANIPFTKENIRATLENIFIKRHHLFELSVSNVFDELTRYFKGNTNHTEGWATNDSYKVNKKIVFPYGCSYDSKYGNRFESLYYSRFDIYEDLDRILCVLDGKDFSKCHTIKEALNRRFEILGSVKGKFDNETESRYFHIKFFKKGTVHLVFKDDYLWEKFNIAAAKGKAWLGENTRKKAA